MYYIEGLNNIDYDSGDTDTNGCIIGALIGSLLGYKAIATENPDWIKKILECKPQHKRDNYLPLMAV
jgi:ADP-ribosylglycohydrolase